MTGQQSSTAAPSGRGDNLIEAAVLRFRLLARLLMDSRISLLLKLLPIGALIYVLIPDFPGPFDDALAIFAGTSLFFELCPRKIVTEHLRALNE